VPGALQHVMARGIERTCLRLPVSTRQTGAMHRQERIFKNRFDKEDFLKRLAASEEVRVYR